MWSDKNTLRPENLLAGSRAKIIFNCESGHEFTATLNKVTLSSRGCPQCVDFHNPDIEKLLQKILGGTLHVQTGLRWPNRNRTHVVVDLLLANDVVVEYDGSRWHSRNGDRDERKTQLLVDNGYKVVRIREKGIRQFDYEHPNVLVLEVTWTRDEVNLRGQIGEALIWIEKRTRG